MATQFNLDNEQEMDTDTDDMDNEEVSVSELDKNQPVEDYNIASRQQLREELSQQIEEFLARGGKINQVTTPPASIRPSKPASDYSGRLM